MKFCKVSETAVIMLAAIGCLFLLLLLLGLLAISLVFPFETPLAYTAGLAVGCLHSAIKVVLIERSIGRSLDMEGKKAAAGYAGLQHILRLFLTAVVLLCAFLFPRVIGLAGTVLGILTLQLSAYTVNPILTRREKRRAQSQ